MLVARVAMLHPWSADGRRTRTGLAVSLYQCRSPCRSTVETVSWSELTDPGFRRGTPVASCASYPGDGHVTPRVQRWGSEYQTAGMVHGPLCCADRLAVWPNAYGAATDCDGWDVKVLCHRPLRTENGAADRFVLSTEKNRQSIRTIGVFLPCPKQPTLSIRSFEILLVSEIVLGWLQR